jgi:Ribosomal protein S7e
MSNPNLKEHMGQIFINTAELVEYQQQDGQSSKCLLIKIPFRSHNAFRKVNEKAVHHLEQKFQWPVIVISSRSIISKRGTFLPSYRLFCSQET